jgi:hypothetical protein
MMNDVVDCSEAMKANRPVFSVLLLLHYRGDRRTARLGVALGQNIRTLK